MPVASFRQGIGKYTIHDSEFFGGPTKFGFRNFSTWLKSVGKRTRPVNGAPGFVLAAGWLLLSALLCLIVVSNSVRPCWESSNFARTKGCLVWMRLSAFHLQRLRNCWTLSQTLNGTGIFTYIWLIFLVNLGKYTSPTESLQYRLGYRICWKSPTFQTKNTWKMSDGNFFNEIGTSSAQRQWTFMICMKVVQQKTPVGSAKFTCQKRTVELGRFKYEKNHAGILPSCGWYILGMYNPKKFKRQWGKWRLNWSYCT